MARYRRNPQTAGRIIDGQAFVVTPADNKLHTLNGLQVSSEQPYASYSLSEYCNVIVEVGAPNALADRIGARIAPVSGLRRLTTVIEAARRKP